MIYKMHGAGIQLLNYCCTIELTSSTCDDIVWNLQVSISGPCSGVEDARLRIRVSVAVVWLNITVQFLAVTVSHGSCYVAVIVTFLMFPMSLNKFD